MGTSLRANRGCSSVQGVSFGVFPEVRDAPSNKFARYSIREVIARLWSAEAVSIVVAGNYEHGVYVTADRAEIARAIGRLSARISSGEHYPPFARWVLTALCKQIFFFHYHPKIYRDILAKLVELAKAPDLMAVEKPGRLRDKDMELKSILRRRLPGNLKQALSSSKRNMAAVSLPELHLPEAP